MLLLLACSSSARADTPLMAGYMACARSIGVAIHERFAVIPGERSGDRGLYVYTDRSAYFLPLGNPHTEDGEAYEYFLRTTVTPVGDIYLDYRDKKPGSRSNILPGIGYQMTAPSQRMAGMYRVARASDSLDERAIDVLRQRLKERLSGIKDFIDSKNSYSTPLDAKLAFEKDRVVYRDKIARCRIEGDRELNAAVTEEAQKLDSGYPGLTVWEKQIGARPANTPQAPVSAR